MSYLSYCSSSKQCQGRQTAFISGYQNRKTSSPKGNDRSTDNKSSKLFEQFSSKRFINWSKAAKSAVHGWIPPNFKLVRDYIVVLGTCKNEKDPLKFGLILSIGSQDIE